MSNISELESISSVCTTAEELIKSEDFMRWVTIGFKSIKIMTRTFIKIRKCFSECKNRK